MATPFVPSSMISGSFSQRPGSIAAKSREEVENSGWLNDSPSDMTLGRRIALYLSQYNWYFPRRAADPNAPSLEAAWAYFEHVSLARYYVKGEEHESDVRDTHYDSHVRAAMGETCAETRLYPICSTPEDQLADFGIGVGMYFNTLKVMAIICFIAGCINIPTMLYYNSEQYSSTGHGLLSSYAMIGSAICTNQTFMPCPSCNSTDWDNGISSKDRFGYSEDENLPFILVNNCYVGFRPGFESWVALIFVFFSVLVMGVIQRRRELKFDLNQQTPSDYSVEVENPPADACDPEEWKEYFSQFGTVTCVTVAIHNTDLVKALVQRRRLLIHFELLLPSDVEMDVKKLEEICDSIPRRPLWKRILCFCSADLHSIYWKINQLNDRIKELLQIDYGVSNVFVTFETENAQRSALTYLSIRKFDAWRNETSAVLPEHVFRGNNILSVREPAEPDSVRWDDLDATLKAKICQKIVTFSLTICFVALNAYFIYLAKQKAPAEAAIVITVLNTVGPMIIKVVEDLIEQHSDEGAKQNSRYIKITLLRWVNTVIVVVITTPFTATLNPRNRENLLYPVLAIFVTEMIKTPLFQLTDIFGLINRHILGPRKPDQRRMNLCFTGGYYELSERYTDLTKVMFLTFFYAIIFPMGYFFAFLTLVVHHLTDKYCLLRLWGPQPKVGRLISKFSRNFFFPAAVTAFAVASAYFWAGFPFDNACVVDSSASSNYQGFHVIKDIMGNSYNTTIYSNTPNYEYCLQDLFYRDAFPPLPKFQGDTKWMSEGQTLVAKIYGWSSVAVVAIVLCFIINKGFFKPLTSILYNSYKPDGAVEGTSFSQVKDITLYVPAVAVPEIPFPLIVCDISKLDLRYLGWEIPNGDYSSFNLIHDIEPYVKEMEGVVDVMPNKIFSTVTHWSPEESAVTSG